MSQKSKNSERRRSQEMGELERSEDSRVGNLEDRRTRELRTREVGGLGRSEDSGVENSRGRGSRVGDIGIERSETVKEAPSQ